ncbi:Transposase IS66 family protein [Halomonas korlensis]|uniref:Transposase IS66 family protein n=1 Tax=Halomonas korlensis TaxID=463301 RepID=A0A1I7J9L2_9GAMM|nr:Transposase IS66 family protein [Halomonas korlensis]
MAHVRRKFVDLHVACKSQIAGQAIELIGQLYQVEREAQSLSAEERQRLRETRAGPIADALHSWMLANREKVPNGSATAKALDYSLKCWAALTRYLDDGRLPIDNNCIKNQIRPWALGRSNWLFAGSLRSGQRAATIVSLIQCAKLPVSSTNFCLTTVSTPPDHWQAVLPVRLRTSMYSRLSTSQICRLGPWGTGRM